MLENPQTRSLYLSVFLYIFDIYIHETIDNYKHIKT